MDEERLKRIDAFLALYEASVATLPTARAKQMERADEAIQHRLAAIEAARTVLQRNGINVSTISADTGISRKTFYNNELLRLYVEHYADTTGIGEQTANRSEYEAVKQKNEELSKQVQKFVLRDIDTENLRQENFALSLEVDRLNNRIKSLESQYERVQTELSEARAQIPAGHSRVVVFPGK